MYQFQHIADVNERSCLMTTMMMQDKVGVGGRGGRRGKIDVLVPTHR